MNRFEFVSTQTQDVASLSIYLINDSEKSTFDPLEFHCVQHTTGAWEDSLDIERLFDDLQLFLIRVQCVLKACVPQDHLLYRDFMFAAGNMIKENYKQWSRTFEYGVEEVPCVIRTLTRVSKVIARHDW